MAVYKYVYWREDMEHEAKRVITTRQEVTLRTTNSWNQPATRELEVSPLIATVGPVVQRVYANVHILRGYTSNSIKAFEELLAVIRAEITKQANKHNVECGKVTQSDYCKGFTILTWSGYLVKQEFPGWYAAKRCDYYW